MSVVVRFCVAEEDAKLAIETTLDVSSIVCEMAGFVLEIVVFLCSVSVAF